MSDKLHEDVRQIVDEIFKKNEEAQMRKETQEALEKSANTITELTDSLEAKDSELAGHREQITKLEETVAGLENTIEEMKKAQEDLEAEKASFESEKEELNKKVEEATEALESMKKDQIAAVRMGELEEAKVASQKKETQLLKIREMTDDEFAAYKEELVSIKESIMAEFNKTNTASSDEVSTDAEMESDVEDASGDSDDESFDDELNPSSIAMAALNMEVVKPSTKMAKRYSDLGRAMAAKYEKGNK